MPKIVVYKNGVEAYRVTEATVKIKCKTGAVTEINYKTLVLHLMVLSHPRGVVDITFHPTEREPETFTLEQFTWEYDHKTRLLYIDIKE